MPRSYKNAQAERLIREFMAEMTEEVLNSFAIDWFNVEKTQRLIANREIVKVGLGRVQTAISDIIANNADEPRRCEFGPEY